MIFSAEQKKAIDAATSLHRGDSVMALIGGPGTGKTTITTQIMEGAVRNYGVPGVLAMAPTGKASRRFAEVTGFGCSTIHRNVLAWERGQGAPPTLRMVVIDEASMVDEELFLRVLHLLPSGIQRILLVGDSEQLPSVGAGSVLRDIISSECLPIFRLNHVYRQSEHSWIRENARRINIGQRPFVEDESEDYFEILEDDPEKAVEQVRELAIANPKAQVLVPTYKGPLGATNLNEVVREAVNPSNGRAGWKAGKKVFRRHDRVIHKVNNYDLDVMNGEVGTAVGLVKNQDDDHDMLVDYEGRRVQYPRDVAADELKLAFALTVHSSQGSEYEDAIVICHSTHAFLLSRPLFYTAVTRARKRVWIVGNDKGIRLAVKKNDPRDRKTLLTERIKEAFKR